MEICGADFEWAWSLPDPVDSAAVMHLLVDRLTFSYCSDSCRTVDRGILISRRFFDNCGKWQLHP